MEGQQRLAFARFPDFSKKNAKRHDQFREDTFKTPPKARHQSREATNRSTVPVSQLFEASEISLVSSMKTLSAEVCQAIEGLRQEVSESVRSVAEDSMRTMLAEALEKIDAQGQVQRQRHGQDTDAGICIADLAPMQEEGVMREEHLQRMEDRLTQKMSRVLAELDQMWARQERVDSGLQEIRDQADKVEGRSVDRMEGVLQTLHCILAKSDSIIQAVQEAQEDNKRSASALEPCLDLKFRQHLQDQPLRVDISQIMEQGKLSMHSWRTNFANLMCEISKVQQALNIEFSMPLAAARHSFTGPRFSGTDMLSLPGEVGEGCSPGGSVAVATHTMSTMSMGVSAWEAEAAGAAGDMWPCVVRVREYGSQTEHRTGTQDAQCQTQYEPAMSRKGSKKKDHARQQELMKIFGKEGSKPTPRKSMVFPDGEKMKKKAREALTMPQYDVANYYHTEGCAQHVVKSPKFDNMTCFVILLNCVWIAVETDYNPSPLLIDSHAVFQVAENLFALYFTVEIAIRFLAFRDKIDAFKDRWFLFDSTLVLLMVVETWILSFILLVTDATGRGGARLGGSSLLRIVRVVRLLRISRMARVLRAIPELVIILKGIGAAARSVCVFLVLWLFIVYVFAIVFRQATDEDEDGIGDKYFQSVPDAMNTLALDGILPDNAAFVHDLADANPLLWPIVMVFILFASLTLMYMLLGVLVETVRCVAATEKEGVAVINLSRQLRMVTARLGMDVDEDGITKAQFDELVCDPSVVHILQEEGVDPLMMIDLVEEVYEGDNGQPRERLSFDEFVGTVMSMRGNNPAKVKDVKHQLRAIKAEIRESSQYLLTEFNNELMNLRQLMKDLKSVDLAGEFGGDGDTDDEESEARYRIFNSMSSSLGSAPHGTAS